MAVFLPRNLYGIIGWPLAQTLSPLIHNIGFQVLGLPGAYFSWPLPPEKLDAFPQAMRLLDILGCSVTIPHKIAILPHLDNVTEQAALAGAVNTLFWRDDLLCGDNTDVTGFLAPLKPLPLNRMEIMLLGAGGAAHAAAAGLRMSGAHARVASPGNKSQFALAERFGFTSVLWENRYDRPAALVINSTPLGMIGKFENESPYDFARAPAVEDGWAYDLVYNPLETLFLREADRAGRRCVSGFAMFLGQGNAQFRIWTGHDLPPEAEQELKKALAQRRKQ